MDLSCDPVSEPKEVSSVAPVTILSATPPMAPSDTSDQEEEVEEEEEGRETESEKVAEELPLAALMSQPSCLKT